MLKRNEGNALKLRIHWSAISIGLVFLYLVFSIYCFSISIQNNYIGIRGRLHESGWQVQRIYSGGLAEAADVQVGDTILHIDSLPAGQHQPLSNWLVAEQLETITIKRNGDLLQVVFPTDGSMDSAFVSLFLLSLGLMIFLVFFYRRQIYTGTSELFYVCIATAAFILLSVYPSSLGDTPSRLVVISGLSLFPIYGQSYINQGQTASKQDRFMRWLWLIALLHLLLSLSAYIFAVPYVINEYLSVGFIVLLLGVMGMQCALFLLQKKKRQPSSFQMTKINIPLVTVVCLAPLLFFYGYPKLSTAPYAVLLLFLLLPLFCVFHYLTVQRVLKFRYRMSRGIIFMLLTAIISLVIFASMELVAFVPAAIVKFYIVILIYTLLPIFDELMLLANGRKQETHSFDIFLAVEQERETISSFIHDQVIQDMIHLIRSTEANQAITTEEIQFHLEETMYDLRELCSDIYPLLLKEVGLTQTLKEIIVQFEQRFQILIHFAFDQRLVSESAAVNIFILRSIKELINNSILHGQATEITIINYRKEQNMVIEVIDNGVFDGKIEANHLHFGLHVIKEKLSLLAGELEMKSDPTTIRLKIPQAILEGDHR